MWWWTVTLNHRNDKPSLLWTILCGKTDTGWHRSLSVVVKKPGGPERVGHKRGPHEVRAHADQGNEDLAGVGDRDPVLHSSPGPVNHGWLLDHLHKHWIWWSERGVQAQLILDVQVQSSVVIQVCFRPLLEGSLQGFGSYCPLPLPLWVSSLHLVTSSTTFCSLVASPSTMFCSLVVSPSMTFSSSVTSPSMTLCSLVISPSMMFCSLVVSPSTTFCKFRGLTQHGFHISSGFGRLAWPFRLIYFHRVFGLLTGTALLSG